MYKGSDPSLCDVRAVPAPKGPAPMVRAKALDGKRKRRMGANSIRHEAASSSRREKKKRVGWCPERGERHGHGWPTRWVSGKKYICCYVRGIKCIFKSNFLKILN